MSSAALATGTIMPDLAVTDAAGDLQTLRGLTAGRRALVYFMRTASCPVCNAHVQTIERQGFDDVATIVVTPGGVDEVATVARRTSLTVVGSGDSGHAQVGLGRFLGLQHSGTVVLDTDGTILLARSSTLPTGSFELGEVEALLA